MAEDAVAVAGLHDAPFLHHHDLVGDVGHHRQVVADKQHADVALFLQRCQQLSGSAPVW